MKRAYQKLEACTDSKTLSKLRKKDVTSLKTSLYLFYILALFSSQALAMTDISVSDNIREYLQSVSYGVVFLFALDKFFEYLNSDTKRIKKYQDRCKDKSKDH